MRNITLEDCCEFILDGTHGSPVKTESGIPVLSAQNVVNGGLDFSTNRFTTLEEYELFKRRLDVQRNDVLLTIVGTIGRVGIVTDSAPLVFQRSVAVLRADEKIVFPKFLFYALQNNSVKKQLAKGTNQSSQAGIYLGKLKKVEIPLPPLDEQKRIAEVLDKADALRRKRRRALQKLDTLLQSVFLEMFGDPVKNPKGWDVVKIKDLSKVGTGSTPSRENSSYYGGDIPWIKTTEVNGGIINDTEEKLTKLGLENSSCKLYPPKSIIIAMYGQGLTRGRCAITDIQATTNQACGVILPSEKYNSDFLFSLLKINYENLRSLGRGGNQPNLNLDIVKNYPIPLPSIELQNKFSNVVKKIEKMKNRKQISMNYVENLFQSLQQKAFKGELFNGDSTDELDDEKKVWQQTSLF